MSSSIRSLASSSVDCEMLTSSRQYLDVIKIGANQHFIDRDSLVFQNVNEPRLVREAKCITDMRFRNVSIDEHDRQFAFQGNARGQVHGTKCLTCPRKWARQHDQVHMILVIRLMLERIVDQGPLDTAKFVGDRNSVLKRSQ